MAVFVEPWNNNELDWILLQNGAVNLYWKIEILDIDINTLRNMLYDVCIFDTSNWENEKEFHDEVKTVLNFPDYYGMNLNAFNDCIRDIESEKTGTVIVLKHYDVFIDKYRDTGYKILDIMEYQARNLLLLGERLMVLVQIDNPDYIIPPLGGRSPVWNNKECLQKNRIK